MSDPYANFTNDQIRQALVSLSGEVSYGPVTDFTRNSYLKKLRELQLSKRGVPQGRERANSPRNFKQEATDENQAIVEDNQCGQIRRGKAVNSPLVSAHSKDAPQRHVKAEPKSSNCSPRGMQIKSEDKDTNPNQNPPVASRQPSKVFTSKIPQAKVVAQTIASPSRNTRKRKQTLNNEDKQSSISDRRAGLAQLAATRIGAAPAVNLSSSDSVFPAPSMADTMNIMRPAPDTSTKSMSLSDVAHLRCAATSSITHGRLDCHGNVHASQSKYSTTNNLNVLPAASRRIVPESDTWPCATAKRDFQLDDCMDEHQAYRTHILESFFCGVRWLFIVALCGALASVMLHVAFRNADGPHMLIEDRSSALATSSSGAYPFRYCETYHFEPAECVIEPPTAQHLMQVAEQIVVDAAANALCSCDFECGDCPVRMRYDDFVSELGQRFGSAVNMTAQYLVVLLAESHANSALHFLDDSGVRLQLVQREGDQWHVSLDLQSVHFVEPSDIVDSFLPLTCRLRRIGLLILFTLHRLFAVVCVFTAMLALAYFGWLFYERAARRRAAEQDRLYALIERVFAYLRENSDPDQWVPLPYVRDALIAPRERSSSSIKCWQRAVTILKSEESRVRFAVRNVDGEEFECMKLARTAQERERTEKGWHGRVPQLNWKFSANTKLRGEEACSSPGLNVQLPAEYRCLKILQMFDPLLEQGDDWHLRIQDALIEKCSLLRKGFVNHVFVDKHSQQGIVYIKLSNSEAAREARELLHGSWFGSRLLIVKYVSIRRYLDRFADARDSDCCRLQPSSTCC